MENVLSVLLFYPEDEAARKALDQYQAQLGEPRPGLGPREVAPPHSPCEAARNQTDILEKPPGSRPHSGQRQPQGQHLLGLHSLLPTAGSTSESKHQPSPLPLTSPLPAPTWAQHTHTHYPQSEPRHPEAEGGLSRGAQPRLGSLWAPLLSSRLNFPVPPPPRCPPSPGHPALRPSIPGGEETALLCHGAPGGQLQGSRE